MPTPAVFWPEALPWAQQAHAQTGVLTSVILAQWADETEYGGEDWSPNNNPGNVGSFDGQPVARFPTLAEGVAAYIQLMNAPDRPEFAATIRKAPTYQQQCELLGAANPVWASGRYALPGGAPGSALVWIIETYGLTRFDGAPQTPPPSPTPTPTTQGVFMIPSGCTDQGAVRAQIREWWATFRSDALTGADSDLFALVFATSAANKGYGGNPDLLLAGIIDGATQKGTLRPQFVNAA